MLNPSALQAQKEHLPEIKFIKMVSDTRFELVLFFVPNEVPYQARRIADKSLFLLIFHKDELRFRRKI